MFGYIRTVNDELKVRDSKFYHSLYCGLCANMKKHYRLYNLTLSYDFVFLALIRLGVYENGFNIIRKRCPYNPFKKKNIVDCPEILDTVSYCSAVLTYYKADDDVRDEKGAKRTKARFIRCLSKKTLKHFERDDTFEKHLLEDLNSINRLESEKCGNVYEPAEVFGDLLGNVFSYKIDDSSVSRVLFEFGMHIGRWIYLIDAFNDIKDDLKRGNYNPIIVSGAYEDKDFASIFESALVIELAEAEKALNIINVSNETINNLIDNIMHLGMPEAVASATKDFLKGASNDRPI